MATRYRDYRVWTIIAGALGDEEEYDFEIDRDARAGQLTADLQVTMRDDGDWSVWVADVTVGCAVGEFAGEEAREFAGPASPPYCVSCGDQEDDVDALGLCEACAENLARMKRQLRDAARIK